MTGTERIDAELKKRGLSRRGFAIKAGIPPSSFQSAMERNDGFSFGMLVKIATALDMDIDGLIAIIQGSEHSETNEMETGALIRAKRHKAGMTQAELAEKSGVSVMSIRRYESGERVITESTLQRIAAALGVNPRDLSPVIEIDKSDENFLNALPRLKNAPIVHDGMGSESEIVFQGLTARWRDAVGLYGSPTCSNCGSGVALKTRFCPHCGARMENAVREQVET